MFAGFEMQHNLFHEPYECDAAGVPYYCPEDGFSLDAEVPPPPYSPTTPSADADDEHFSASPSSDQSCSSACLSAFSTPVPVPQHVDETPACFDSAGSFVFEYLFERPQISDQVSDLTALTSVRQPQPVRNGCGTAAALVADVPVPGSSPVVPVAPKAVVAEPCKRAAEPVPHKSGLSMRVCRKGVSKMRYSKRQQKMEMLSAAVFSAPSHSRFEESLSSLAARSLGTWRLIGMKNSKSTVYKYDPFGEHTSDAESPVKSAPYLLL